MKEYKRWTVKNWREDKHTKAYDRLAELEDKIDDGTLIELPCKVGEAFYYLDANQHDGWFIDIRRFDYAYLKIMGKYGFTTKAEAEAKLKELQEKDNDR